MLGSRLGVATEAQLVLASGLGIVIEPVWPALVVAEIIRAGLRSELCEPPGSAPSFEQMEYLADIIDLSDLIDLQDFPNSDFVRNRGENSDSDEGVPTLLASKALVSAWIHLLLGRRTMRALQTMQLEGGDIVQVTSDHGTTMEIVSSISDTGRVNFIGGRGRGAWPHKLRIVARRQDQGPEPQRLRDEITNLAELPRSV